MSKHPHKITKQLDVDNDGIPDIVIPDGIKGSDSSFDNRGIINAAIDDLSSKGGGTIYLPAGTYYVTGTGAASAGAIQIKSNITLRGAGMGVTTIKVVDGNTNAITGVVRTPTGARTTNVTIMDLTIDGNDTNKSGGDVNACFFCGVTPMDQITGITETGGTATYTVASASDNPSAGDTVHIFGVEEGGTIAAVYLGDKTVAATPTSTTFTVTGIAGSPADVTDDVWFFGNSLENARDENINLIRVECTDSNTYGFDPHQWVRGLTMTDCIAHNTTNDGFVIDGCEDVTIKGCRSYSNSRHGFNLVTATRDIVIDSCIAYDNADNGFIVQRGSDTKPWCQDVVISNCLSYSNDKEGMRFRMTKNLSVQGCRIYDNNRDGIQTDGLKNASIKQNTIYDNGQEGTNTYDGIVLLEEDDSGVSGNTFASTEVIIKDNTIYSTESTITHRYGINETDDSSDTNIAEDNNISDTGTGDVVITGAASVNRSTRADDNYITNHYYYPTVTGGATSTKSMTAGRIYYAGPFMAKESTTITRLGVSIGTGTASGGDTAILGVYTDNDGVPNLLVGTNNAEVAIDVATQVEATVSVPVIRGKYYWFAINCEANVTLESFANSNNVRDGGVAYNTTSTILKDTVAYAATLPATSAATVSDYTGETAPLVWFRVV